MRHIEWGYQATLDLEDIVDYYEGIDSDLSEKMIRRIEDAALPLLDNSRIGAGTGRLGLRKWAVRNTFYMLLYIVEGDLIFIVRVIHAASDWENSV